MKTSGTLNPVGTQQSAASALQDPEVLTFGVIICCYTDRRWALLVDSISGVLAQQRTPEHFVVVVDHNDELRQRLEAQFPEVRVVANAGGRGVNGARNTGVDACDTDIVVFLDDDATPERGWVAALEATLSDGRTVGAAGHIEAAWSTGRPAWFPPEFDWIVGCSYRGLPGDGEITRNPIGANMAVRRAPLLDISGFDDGVGRVGANTLGCDETEVFIRLTERQPDQVTRMSRGAVVHHHVPAERSTFGYFVRRCWSEGRSKALMSRRTGTGVALSSERAYVRSVLPRGVLRGARDGLTGDLGGLQRSIAIVVGLVVTTIGFTAGRIGALGQRGVKR